MSKTKNNKKHYLYRDGNVLDIRFYEAYDESFLLQKAKTLLLVADSPDEFRNLVDQRGGDIIIQGDNEAYVQALRAEVHFTEFHQLKLSLPY